jgi:hypothetical protein
MKHYKNIIEFIVWIVQIELAIWSVFITLEFILRAFIQIFAAKRSKLDIELKILGVSPKWSQAYTH